MSDFLTLLNKTLPVSGTPDESTAPQSPYSPWSAAGKELLFSSTAGMLGLQSKDPEIVKFQEEHPVISTGVDMLGFLGPYSLMSKFLGKVPALARAVEAVSTPERIAAAPFAAGAMKQIVQFAPVEAVRLAGNALLGDQLAENLDAYNMGTGAVAKEAAMNLALGGFVGGAFEKLQSGKGLFRARRDAGLTPGANQDDPIQLQLRQMQDALANGQVSEDMKPATLAQINNYRSMILSEEPEALRAISSQNALAGKADLKGINALWKANEEPNAKIGSYKLLPNSMQKLGLDTDTLAALGNFPTDWHGYVQVPRLVQGGRQGAKVIQNRIRNAFDPVDGNAGLWAAREGDDGLYVMAKKVQGQPDVAQRGDRWLLWKTDSPGKFAPDRENWARMQLQRSAWMLDDADTISRGGVGSPIFDDVVKFNDEIRAPDFRAVQGEQGNVSKVAEYFLKKAGIDPRDSEALQNATKLVNQYVTPAMFQFRNAPLAQKLFSGMKMAFERSNSWKNELLYGKPDTTGKVGTDVWKSMTEGGGRPADSVEGLISKLEYSDDPNSDWYKLWQARQFMLTPDQALEKLNIGPEGYQVLKGLEAADNLRNAHIAATEAVVGLKNSKRFEPLSGHYGISARWKGDWRTAVTTEHGRLIAVGGGESRQEAIKAAEKLAEDARQYGINPKVQEPVLRGGSLSKERVEAKAIRAAIAQDARVAAYYDNPNGRLYNPKRYNEAQGTKGYIGEKTPWTKKELMDNLAAGYEEDAKRMAKMTIERVFERQLGSLERFNPEAFKLLNNRYRQMQGIQGPVGKFQNDMVDKFLAPVMGKNSATKIVQTANDAMMKLTLGFGNIGYAMATMLNFLQVSLPHLAWLTTAAPERILRYYTYLPVQGLKTAGGMGMLDIMKLTQDSFRLLGKPESVLDHAAAQEFRVSWARATRDGVWDPKFVENFAGEGAVNRQKLKEALSGKEGVASFINSVANFTPGLAEKFSRGHTYVLGWLTGNKILGLSGEHLYQFAKEFTEKTQFNYSAADRALVTTGPFGTAFGLFKNWMLHYLGWWAQYTGEGLYHGNWKPLLWMTGSTAMAGGIGAMPFFSSLDSFSQMLNDKNVMQNTYSTLGGDREHLGLGDAVYYGLPGMLGFSVQNQVAMPFRDPGKDASYLFSLAYLDRMKAFGTAAGQAYDYMVAAGQHPANNNDVLDNLIKAFAPKALYRASSMDWNTGAVRSITTGNPVVDSLPVAQRILYTLGMNPKNVEMGYAISDQLWKEKAEHDKMISTLGKAWAEAETQGQYDEMKRLVLRAVSMNLDVSSVIKSGKRILAKGREQNIEDQFSPKSLYEYRMLNLVK